MGLVAAPDGVPTDYARSNAAGSRESVSCNPDDIINNWRSFRENIRSNVTKINNGEIKGSDKGYKVDNNIGKTNQNSFLKNTPL